MYDTSLAKSLLSNKLQKESDLEKALKPNYEEELEYYNFMEKDNPLYTHAIEYSKGKGKEKKVVVKKMREEVKNWLKEKHNLSNISANILAKPVKPINLNKPHDKTNLLEDAGLFIANGNIGMLPTHYVKIYGELTKQDLNKISKDSVKLDWIFTAGLATLALGVPAITNILSDENFIKPILKGIEQTASYGVKGNLAMKSFQLPYRTTRHIKGKHTPGYSSLITPAVLDGLALLPTYTLGTLRDMQNSKNENYQKIANKIFDSTREIKESITIRKYIAQQITKGIMYTTNKNVNIALDKIDNKLEPLTKKLMNFTDKTIKYTNQGIKDLANNTKFNKLNTQNTHYKNSKIYHFGPAYTIITVPLQDK